MNIKAVSLILCGVFITQSALAGQAEILKVEMVESESGWLVRVTLKHDDTGWEHYADAWRLVDHQGNVVGHRTLHHPHVNEQPFTRSQNGVQIPSDIRELFVEAHDSVHGWNPEQVKIDLQKELGERYRILRLPKNNP